MPDSPSRARNTMMSQMLALEPRLVFDGAMAATQDAMGDGGELMAVAHDGRAEDGGRPHADRSRSLVFVDRMIEDAEAIAAGIDASTHDVVWLDPAQDGVAQVGTALERAGTVDAVHIVTHGAPGTLRLGATAIDANGFDGVASGLAGWADHLTPGADILLYGCELGQGEAGRAFLGALSAATGADVAASDDLTGAARLGGDWDLEVTVGDVEAEAVAAGAFVGVLAAEPDAVVTDLDDPLIGEDFTFTVRFDNASASDTGFAPYVNLILPTTGADGAYDAGTDSFATPADGVTFQGATFFGQPVEVQTATIVDDGSGGLEVTHPVTEAVIAVDADLNLKAGDTLHVLTLPFGSYTPDQPVSEITVAARMSPHADPGTPLNIVANAGFALGEDALNNPDTDPPIQSATFEAGNMDVSPVEPQLYSVETAFSHPGGDTATGPNHVRSMTVTVTVAPGQTLTDADISLTLPEQLVFVGADPDGGTLAGAPAQNVAGATADDIVTANFASLAGTKTITIDFYVSDRDQVGASVLDPATGDARVIDMGDRVSVAGSWTPADPRDSQQSRTTGHDATDFTARALDLDKSVANVTDAQNSVGDRLRYTLDLDMADTFAGDDIVVTDLISDGQNFDAGVAPVLTFTDQGTAHIVVLTDPAHYAHTVDGGPNYTETLVFDVSAAIQAAVGRTHMEGGRFAGDTSVVSNVRIVYDAVIQDKYADPGLDPNDFVKENDALVSEASVTARNLDPALAPQGSNTLDDADGTTVVLAAEKLDITVHAINGSTSGALDALRPGDDVTVRLRYDLVSGDFRNFDLRAFLPLPVLSVADTDADGDTDGDDPFTEDTVNAIPDVGKFAYGPDATAGTRTLTASNVTTEAGSNVVAFDFEDRDDTANGSDVIDVLFTIRVNDEPFADGLKLTFLGQTSNDNTPGEAAVTNEITAITLQQPAIPRIVKGAVATDATDGAFGGATPAGIKAAGNTDANPLTQVVTSANLASLGLDADLSGVDAGDVVRFAIVVENTGSSDRGAFDVTLRDAVPAGFEAPAGNLNLRAVNGAGAAVAIESGDLFAPNGIRFADGATGALAGSGVAGGENILIVTYDLVVADAAEAARAYTSEAVLTNFAGKEGGADHTVADLTDAARVTIDGASIAKTVTATSQGDLTDREVVVGEVVTYETVITIPEGTSTEAVFTDTLAEGLAFLGASNVTITASAGLATDGSTDFTTVIPTFSDGGTGTAEAASRHIRFDFGTLTNENADDATPETITITYAAVVTNDAQTDAGDTLGGGGAFVTAGETTSVATPTVTVREPNVSVTIDANTGAADARDVVTWTVTLTAAADSGATAHDVDLTSVIPAGTDYVGGSLSTPTGAPPASLTESGGTISGTWTSLAPGQTSTFTFQTEVEPSVALADTVRGRADVAWSSLPGAGNDDIAGARTTVDSERDGGGGTDDYVDDDDDDVRILLAEPVLTVDATSEASNGATATIGEIVRYRMVLPMPESVTDDLIVAPSLPDHLRFLDDETATVAFLSDGGLTSGRTTLGGAAVSGDENDLAATDPTHIIAATDIVNADDPGQAFAAGDDPAFHLGRITNADEDADAEFIVIEYNAIVVNAAGTDAGVSPSSEVAIRSGAHDLIRSASVEFDVVEPDLTALAKTVVATDGARATYEISFANTSGQTAHDVRLADVAGANLTDVTVTGIATAGTVTGTADTSTGNDVTVAFDGIADGATVTVTYTADIVDAAQPVTSTDATLTWTSLPGSGPSLAGSGPGAAGADAGERTGDGSGPNDYAASDDAGLGFVSGTLYEDIDQDSVIDATDPRLGDTDIRLIHAGADGDFDTAGDNVVLTARTAADGSYSFAALPSGALRLSVATTGTNGLPAGYTALDDAQGPGTDNRIARVLGEGGTITGNDFAVLSPNSAPLFTSLGSPGPGTDAVHVEDGGATVLDADASLSDPELDPNALDSWAGAVLTVQRAGGADGRDLFGATAALAGLADGGTLELADGTVIGTVTRNDGGRLVLTFGGDATTGRVTEALRALTYLQVEDDPTGPVTLSYTITDGNAGAQGSGGTLMDSGTLEVAITPTNDTPTGADRTIALQEDTPHTFAAVEFGFTDKDSGDVLAGVRIDTLSTSGTLTLDGAPIAVGQTIAAGDVAGLVYTPAQDAHGSPSDAFTFSVRDDSGDAGSEYAAAYSTITFDVASVNDAPGFASLGAGGGAADVTHVEGAGPTVLDADLSALDPELDALDDWDGATFTLVRTAATGGPDARDVFGASDTVGPLVQGQRLTVGGTDIGAVTQNANGQLALTFSAHATSARVDAVLRSLTYTYGGDNPPAGIALGYTLDDGNAGAQGAGGALTGAGTLQVAIIATNDAPTGADRTVLLQEDAPHSFTAAQFGFADVDIGDALVGIRIDTLPAKGLLSLGGTPVAAGQTVGVADVPKLVFTPETNDTGTAADLFTFSVRDDSGDAGSEYDAAPNTFTFDIAPVNDAPTFTGLGDGTAGLDATFMEAGNPIVLDLDVTPTDPELVAAGTWDGATFILQRHGGAHADDVFGATAPLGALTQGGQLTVSGTDIGTVDENAGGRLVLSFGPDATPARVAEAVRSLTYELLGDNPPNSVTLAYALGDGNAGAQGTGGTLTGGGTLEVAIVPENDLPTGADMAAAISEDGAHRFATSEFGFSDRDNVDTLAGVRIDTLPKRGSLTLGGRGIAAGETIATADIPRLEYAPAADENGAGYAQMTFSVKDTTGGYAAAPNTFTFNVDPVNDAPGFASLGTGGAGADVTHVEGVGPTVLDPNLSVLDPELDAADGWNGATFTLMRSPATGGPDIRDVFAASGPLGPLTQGQAVTVDGKAIGTVTQNAGGRLMLTFGSDATSTRVNEALRAITYAYDGDNPPAGIALDYALDDGNVTGAQGSGGRLTGAGVLRVAITATNDAPTGADRTIAIQEDMPHTFRAAEFGFADVDIGDSLASVRIDALPAHGGLALNGTSVTEGQTVGVADIPNLIFMPEPHASGIGYAQVSVSVRDTAGGYSDAPNVLTFDVEPIADGAILAIEDIVAEPGDPQRLIVDLTLADGDGSEVLAEIVITGVPADLRITTGTGVPVPVVGGVAEIAPEDLAAVRLDAVNDLDTTLTIQGVTVDTNGARAPFQGTFGIVFASNNPGLPTRDAFASALAHSTAAASAFPTAGIATASTAAASGFGSAAGSDAGFGGGSIFARPTATDRDPIARAFDANRAFRDAAGLSIYLTGDVADQLMLMGEVNVIKIPKGTFQHSDPSETLTINVERADGGGLPPWLTFDAEELLFTGVPPQDASDALEFVIVARDSQGNEVREDFKIVIVPDAQEAPRPQTDADARQGDGTEDETVRVTGADAATIIPRWSIDAPSWDANAGERIELADQFAAHSRQAELAAQARFLQALAGPRA